MKTLLEKYAPLRAPDDPGAGGGATPPAAPPATAPPAGGNQPPDPGAPPAAPPAAPAEPPAAGQPYRPEGLPETMFGKDDRETLDKVAGALKGYRDRDAARVVPDKVEAYREFGDLKDVPEAVRPHMAELAKDPLFDAVAKVAMEERIPVATLHKLTTSLFAQAAEAGILDAGVDPATERAALLPEAAKALPKADQDKAIDARMQANEDFIKLLSKPGADGKPQLDPKVGEHALLMLMDTAQGNQFLEFMQAQMTGGGRAQPLTGQGGQAGGADARAALRAEQALPQNTPGNPLFDKASYDALDAKYKQMFPA